MSQIKDTTDDTQRIVEWIERNIGGQVVQVERQSRWRPAWTVALKQDGSILSLYVRGDREVRMTPYSLEREVAILQVVEANGFPVPHVYGICDQPRAIVLGQVRGEGMVGLNRPAMEQGVVEADDERRASLKHYVEILARIHAIDIAQFEAAGIQMPITAEGIALNGFEAFYQLFVEAKRRPEPLIDFLRGWLQRNVPRHRTRVTFCVGDAGQFNSEGGKVTAITDLEAAQFGDNMYDLAAFRLRTMVEPMGDLAPLYRHYAEVMGEDLDFPTIAYHTVNFFAIAHLAVTMGRTDPRIGSDWAELSAGSAHEGRLACEAIAEILEIDLDPVERLTPRPSREDVPIAKLGAEIQGLPTADSFHAWHKDSLVALVNYLQNVAQLGATIEEQDLHDVAELLGRRPADWLEADTELKRFVLEAGPEQDARLVRLFHKRQQRRCLLHAGPMASMDHHMLQRLEPLRIE